MALRFVHIEHFSRLTCKRWIDLKETLGYVFMYRTLANSELLRRLPHRRLILNNIIRNLHRALFDIIFHKNPCIICLYNLCRDIKEYAECMSSMFIIPLLYIEYIPRNSSYGLFLSYILLYLQPYLSEPVLKHILFQYL